MASCKCTLVDDTGQLPATGYTIDYSSEPYAISRWSQSWGNDLGFNPLPRNLRLLYTEMVADVEHVPNVEHVREFTVEQVRSMSLHELDIAYAAALYEQIFPDIPGDSPGDSPAPAPPPAPPAPPAPESYDSPNWQDETDPDERTSSVAVIQERQYNADCPFCQHKFTVGQPIQTYRCGHAACTNCFDDAMRRGWLSCTICRKSSTTRVAVAQNNDANSDDIGVFIRPRAVVERDIERAIKKCRAQTEETAKQSWTWPDS